MIIVALLSWAHLMCRVSVQILLVRFFFPEGACCDREISYANLATFLFLPWPNVVGALKHALLAFTIKILSSHRGSAKARRTIYSSLRA